MQTAAVVLVSAVVALFGVMSAVLEFKAEAKRLTRDEIYVSGRECVYPASPAYTLGISAVFLLAVAQVFASAARRGCCCRRPPGGGASSTRQRAVGVVASVLSWLAASIAVAFYSMGVTWNAPTTRQAKFAGPVEECNILRGGVFATAAALTIVATSLGIVSCVLLRLPAAAAKDAPEQGQQHAVGMPEWQAPDPKFAPTTMTQGQAHAQV